MENTKVFLGGTCNNSTWREELIPFFKAYKIDFFKLYLMALIKGNINLFWLLLSLSKKGVGKPTPGIISIGLP